MCETVALFNTSAASKAVIIDFCGVTPGADTMSAFRLNDKLRIEDAAWKVSTKYKEQKQKLRAQRKTKTDKNAYHPGGFGLSSKPTDTL